MIATNHRFFFNIININQLKINKQHINKLWDFFKHMRNLKKMNVLWALSKHFIKFSNFILFIFFLLISLFSEQHIAMPSRVSALWPFSYLLPFSNYENNIELNNQANWAKINSSRWLKDLKLLLGCLHTSQLCIP